MKSLRQQIYPCPDSESKLFDVIMDVSENAIDEGLDPQRVRFELETAASSIENLYDE
jgi:hypothetical protein